MVETQSKGGALTDRAKLNFRLGRSDPDKPTALQQCSGNDIVRQQRTPNATNDKQRLIVHLDVSSLEAGAREELDCLNRRGRAQPRLGPATVGS